MKEFRTFRFTISVDDNETGQGIIEIDNEIIEEGLSEEFKKYFYDLRTPEGVASHLAWAMVVRGYEPEQIEGWTNLNKDTVVITRYPSGYDDFEVTAEEIKVK